LAVNTSAWTPQYQANGGQVPGHILRGSRVGHGAFLVSGAMRTTDYTAGATGWSIHSDGSVDFNSGNFRGDITGASGTFSGTVTARSLDIPDAVSAASAHIDALGNFWVGATTLGAAPFSVTNAGVAVASNLTISGTSTMNGSLIVNGSVSSNELGTDAVGATHLSSIALGAGKHIQSTSYSAGISGWEIDADGSAEFNNVTVRGAVYATSGSFSGSLSAATGSFAGSLSAATGSFTGAVTATSGSFTGAVTATSGSFTGTLRTGSSGNYIETVTGTNTLDFYDATVRQGTVKFDSAAYTKFAIYGPDGVNNTTDGILGLGNGRAVFTAGYGQTTYIGSIDGGATNQSAIVSINAQTNTIIGSGALDIATFTESGNVGHIAINSTHATEGGELLMEAGTGDVGYDDVTLDNYSEGTGASAYSYLRFIGGATQIWRMRADTALYSLGSTGGRDVHISSLGTFVYDSSTENHKEDISSLVGADLVPRAKSLRAVQYRPKEEFSAAPDNSYQIGFIAEEVAALFPEVVWFDPDEADGLTVPVGVDYKRLVPVLFALWQDTEARLINAGI